MGHTVKHHQHIQSNSGTVILAGVPVLKRECGLHRTFWIAARNVTFFVQQETRGGSGIGLGFGSDATTHQIE